MQGSCLGHRADMPLADDMGLVACPAQGSGQGQDVVRQYLVAAQGGQYAEPTGPSSGQQADPSWRANRIDVVLLEPNTAGREPIEMGQDADVEAGRLRLERALNETAAQAEAALTRSFGTE